MQFMHVEDKYTFSRTTSRRSQEKQKQRKKEALAYRLFDIAEEIIDILD